MRKFLSILLLAALILMAAGCTIDLSAPSSTPTIVIQTPQPNQFALVGEDLARNLKAMVDVIPVEKMFIVTFTTNDEETGTIRQGDIPIEDVICGMIGENLIEEARGVADKLIGRLQTSDGKVYMAINVFTKEVLPEYISEEYK